MVNSQHSQSAPFVRGEWYNASFLEYACVEGNFVPIEEFGVQQGQFLMWLHKIDPRLNKAGCLKECACRAELTCNDSNVVDHIVVN